MVKNHCVIFGKKRIVRLTCYHPRLSRFKNSQPTSKRTIKCDACDKAASFWTIGKDMDVDKKMLFSDPTVVIRSMTARLMGVLSFQDRQHELLKKHALKKIQLNIGILKSLHANRGISQVCSNVVEDDKKKVRVRIFEKREAYEALKERHKKPYPIHVSLGANTNTQESLSIGKCIERLSQQKELSLGREMIGLMAK
uniref:Pentatricopeptide repeat-containing protein n=1 Tax=Strongyloides papillosus TaxID=174720 RepID=A0A0N5C4M5_STREA